MTLKQDYLNRTLPDDLISSLSRPEVYQQKKNDVSKLLGKKGVLPFQDILFQLNQYYCKADVVKIENGQVVFDTVNELSRESKDLITKVLKKLIPWRKGPWNYFGIEIDSEWQSQLKWNRIKNFLPDHKRQKICDIGCNNFYYMYRLNEICEEPSLYGVDPMVRYYYHYYLNQHLCYQDNLCFDLFGVEDLTFWKPVFDTVLFMGILYHRRDPIRTLDIVRNLLKDKGTVLLESACIPGNDPVCLFPESRYCKAPGYWFLPTEKALVNMMKRAGFRSIEILHSIESDTNEQRRTDWAIFESLEDFLDPDNCSKTIEGYPAPIRVYVRARK